MTTWRTMRRLRRDRRARAVADVGYVGNAEPPNSYAGGYLHTGDVAIDAEGYVYIRDRLKTSFRARRVGLFHRAGNIFMEKRGVKRVAVIATRCQMGERPLASSPRRRRGGQISEDDIRCMWRPMSSGNHLAHRHPREGDVRERTAAHLGRQDRQEAVARDFP